MSELLEEVRIAAATVVSIQYAHGQMSHISQYRSCCFYPALRRIP